LKSVDVEIRNPSGLHARPAVLFARQAMTFKSSITLQNLATGKPPVDAKSLIAVLAAGILKGTMVHIAAEGEDETQAIADLKAALESGLGEPLG
jgi:phosphotransferase system HPr (HPr) family protein